MIAKRYTAPSPVDVFLTGKNLMIEAFDVALCAAREAGDILSRFFAGEFSVRSKGVSDLVTDADVAAERRIVEVIRNAFPGHSVLGEEEHSDAVEAEHLWVVDPLDGTTNFAHHIPHFAVSIAYYHGGRAECGVILNPIRNDLYTARRGHGAFHNGRRIQVSPEVSMDETLVGIGFYYDRGAMMEATLKAIGDCFRQGIHGVRRMGTASLDLASVASGLYGAFFEYHLAPWDFAAGQLLVEEAGGRVTMTSGAPLTLNRTTVLASNGALHEAMVATVGKHWPQADSSH